ncbi:hypothetical protein [Subtercola vilae]|uniref:hypothetical protein n=1 Tax=Subtercola vilae TaxID=2056433 RepID=UPI0010AAAB12|nr:hypothetical protein [Subtercola vilae]
MTLQSTQESIRIHVDEPPPVSSEAKMLIQPLPDGEVLVAARDSAWKRSGPEQNAFVLNAHGAIVKTGYVGNDIRVFLSAPNGDTWLGYGDRGIYGSRKGRRGSLDPTQSGIVRINKELEIVERYKAASAEDFIDHCYDINVGLIDAYGYFYESFELVRLGHRLPRIWQPNVPGAKAFLIDGEACAFVGGYDGNSRPVGLREGFLSETGFELVKESEFWLPPSEDGNSGHPHHFVSRGPELHVFQGADWYRASMSEA